LLGSTMASLSSAPFFLSSTSLSAGCCVDDEAIYVPFFAEGGQWVPIVGGLGDGDLSGVLILCVFTTFATCS
jgi:hypothetical protein